VAKPNLRRDYKSFIWMMLAAAFGGFVVAVPGLLIGARVGNSFGGFGDLVGAIAGMIFGYPLGVALGVLVFSRVFKFPGSPWLGALGAVLGMAVVLILAEPLNLNNNSNLMLGSMFLGTSLLATWGFHLKKV
jgi:hypothetical protein